MLNNWHKIFTLYTSSCQCRICNKFHIDEFSKLGNRRKCIVFESQLDDLFDRLKCRECDCPVDMSDTVKDCSSGTILGVSVFCINGHLIHKSSLSSLFGVECVPDNFIGVLLAKNGFAPICEFCMVSSVFTPMERVLVQLLSDLV
jgi:hypothetical protein